jgi:hypothetical protein
MFAAPETEGGGDPGDLSASYNTPLSRAQEMAFQKWRASLPRNLQSTYDYDLRAAWKANAQQAANGHLSDVGKKPNHFTFSTDSIYSTPTQQGGNWVPTPDGKWLFFASPTNARYHSANALQGYFDQYEPDSRLVPPATLNLFRK